MGQDNVQSWVKITYGTIKYVVDSNQNNTEIPADQHERHKQVLRLLQPDQRQKQNDNRKPVDTTTTISMHER